MSGENPPDIYARQLARERAARKTAEVLLEQKSQELYEANQRLRGLNAELEERVIQRTQELALLNQKLEHQTLHDALTLLPNRALFLDRLTHAIRHAERSHTRLAVMFLDLDKFKDINDSLGHSVGDELLRTIAERLKDCSRTSDTVARLGGDEFVFLIVDISDETTPSMVARRLAEVITAPITLANQEYLITSSIGISMYPDDGNNAESLLSCADIAMYQAKKAGRNTFHFFTSKMQDRLDKRISLEKSLSRALQRDEFVLHFQPQVELRSGRIIGLEALIRWQSPDQGLVLPGHFIPIAEESNLIFAIGEWVVNTVCRHARKWQMDGLLAVPIAINVAASQFSHQRIDRLVEHALQSSGLEARYLELELTESLSLNDPNTSIAMMHRLREIGVSLSIDDFGTGYSSLNYLKRFPVNKLKIDQSFIRGLPHDAGDCAITAAVIHLAHGPGLRALAEGVETEAQLNFLIANGCDEMQGYYFSCPLSENVIVEMLQQQPVLNLTKVKKFPSSHVIGTNK